jgi:hypothetical protein
MMRRIISIGLCLLAMVSGVALMQTASPTSDEPVTTPTATLLGAISTSTPTPLPPKPEDPRPAVCSAPYQDGWEAHVVKAGDTLAALMQGFHGLSVTQLAALNCVDDPMALPVGSVVWLPLASVTEATSEVCQQLVKSLDCAAQTQGVVGAQQLFQNGMMIWREDTWEIWVINNGSTSLQVFEDKYVDGETDPSDTPPDTFFVPKRGFGKIWTQLGGSKSPLGWATAPESQISLNIQAAGRESYTSYIQMPDGVIYAATVLPRQSEGWWVRLGGS